MRKDQSNTLSRRKFIGTSTVGMAGIMILPGVLKASEKGLSYYQIRGGISNSQYFFKENKAGNQYLFFIGNSVISGKGLKNEELRYSFQMVNGFKKYFPETRMPERRNMEPGGSWFAQYRTSHGQPVFGEVIYSGHLVILDFAADDRNIAIDQVKCTVEAVVRQITLFRNTHSTILVYTLTLEMLQSYREGKVPEYISISEQIAEHYNIPSLNLAKYVAEKIIDGEISEKEFSLDGINPTDAGAKIYAEAVAAFTDALMTAYPSPDKPKPKELPECLFEGTNDNGQIVAYENIEVKKNGSWKTGQKSPILPFRHIMVSEKIGDSIELKFKGTEIGIIDIVGQDTAELEYSLDGAPFQRLTTDKKVVEPGIRSVALVKDLDRNLEHKFILKVSSAGIVRIGGILLNGTIRDPFEGMSRLEQIDAVYASMDPVVYLPPGGRFANIPKTIEKLEHGGTLRMVLLGDSIMGNTSNSSFELLLLRDHPQCEVIKVPSLRSSTGCNYYKEENRVQEYVLDHNPDLLVIGGISNGGAEPVRTVIRQVRAKKPDTEILLLTKVFGTYSEDQVREIIFEIDTSSSNYRYDLMKVAEEENCAFFDMTGPLWDYIKNSGKTHGWFMKDKVHANARGCQIIGRLLQKWFTS